MRIVQECKGKWAHEPACLGVDRRDGLFVESRWGSDVLNPEAGHDPGKCVRPKVTGVLEMRCTPAGKNKLFE